MTDSEEYGLPEVMPEVSVTPLRDAYGVGSTMPTAQSVMYTSAWLRK